MAQYAVHGVLPVTVHMIVEADDREEAIEIAQRKFGGAFEYAGNGGTDKLVGVEGDDESITIDGDAEFNDAHLY